MKNLLPNFKTFKVDDQTRLPKHSAWKPQRADSSTASIPYYLSSVMKPESKRLPQPPRVPNGIPPNQKYITQEPYSSAEPSPLSDSQRGSADPPKISTKTVIRERKVADDFQERNRKNSLFIWMQNNLAVPVDIFVQMDRNMQAEIVESFGGATMHPIVNSTGKSNTAESYQICSVCVSTSIRTIITTTGNQDIRDFEFEPRAIGLEVEASGARLICCKVLPDSQAAEHGDVLIGGLIVAVNGSRVVTMNEFTSALSLARTTGAVVLRIAIYRGEKGRHHALYEHDILKRNLGVKSTLSSIFKGGIDKDHQHGIELPNRQFVIGYEEPVNSDEEEEEEGEEEEEERKDRGGGGEAKELEGTMESESDGSPTASPSPTKGSSSSKSKSGKGKSGKSRSGKDKSSKSKSRKSGKEDSEEEGEGKKSAKSPKVKVKRTKRRVYDSDEEEEDDDDDDDDLENDPRVLAMQSRRASASTKSPTESSSVSRRLAELEGNGAMSSRGQSRGGDDAKSRGRTASDSKSGPASDSDGSPYASDSKPRGNRPRIQFKDEVDGSLLSPSRGDGSNSRPSSPSADKKDFMSMYQPKSFSSFKKDDPRDRESQAVSKVVGVRYSEDDEEGGMLAGVKVLRVSTVSEDVDAFKFESPPPSIPEAKEEVEVAAAADAKEVVVEEEEESDSDSDGGGSWDYATALDHAETSKFMRITCIPNAVSRSSGWGSPTAYIQFSNFSKYWDIQVYWVDEDSVLIPRKSIVGGDKHVEMVSSNHVWVAMVTANMAALKRNALADLTDESAEERKRAITGVGSDGWFAEEERKDHGSVMLIIRPSQTSLLPDKCTNMVWVPWRSLTASQRSHPVTMPKHKLPPDRRYFNESNGDAILPNMHLQIVDISQSK